MDPSGRSAPTPKYDLEHDGLVCSHATALNRDNRRITMIARSIPSKSHATSTRRQMIAGIGAAALAGLVGSRNLWALPQQQQDTKQASTPANQARTSLHQEIELKA